MGQIPTTPTIFHEFFLHFQAEPSLANSYAPSPYWYQQINHQTTLMSAKQIGLRRRSGFG
jgi:hypothetical protein